LYAQLMSAPASLILRTVVTDGIFFPSAAL